MDLSISESYSPSMSPTIMGREWSIGEIVSATLETIRSSDSAKTSKRSCQHTYSIYVEEKYICNSCKHPIDVEETKNIWIPLEEGVVKIDNEFSMDMYLKAPEL